MEDIGLSSLMLSITQRALLGAFCLHPCTRVPHRESYSLGAPLFKVGIRNRQGSCERQSFCPNRESNPDGPY